MSRQKNSKTGNTDVALEYIRELYGLKEEVQRTSATPKEIHLIRQEQAKPILDDFKK